MPLFFFHLRSPGTTDHDDLGIECADLECAYLEAYRAIPPLAADLLREGSDPLQYTFAIAEAAGNILMEVPFREAIRAKPRRPGVQNRYTRHLSGEITDLIARARETVRQSREILARARDHTP